MISTTCGDCGRDNEAPEALRGVSLECACGASYRVGVQTKARKVALDCPSCEAALRVPVAYAGRRIRCKSCQAKVAVPDPAAEAAAAAANRDEARTVSLLTRRVEDLQNQCGVGFSFFGACVLILALSLRLTLGESLAADVALAAGAFFCVNGALYKLTRQLPFAYMAVLGWFCVALPLGFVAAKLLLSVNVVALAAGPIAGPFTTILAGVFATSLSVFPARVVKELDATQAERERRQLSLA
ncbi:MAG TPA: hypothetical protein DEA08_19275 [Planctomycetes bacterium]|nr:hypothetical protein [Planctomycetota bacterium]